MQEADTYHRKNDKMSKKDKKKTIRKITSSNSKLNEI